MWLLRRLSPLPQFGSEDACQGSRRNIMLQIQTPSTLILSNSIIQLKVKPSQCSIFAFIRNTTSINLLCMHAIELVCRQSHIQKGNKQCQIVNCLIQIKLISAKLMVMLLAGSETHEGKDIAILQLDCTILLIRTMKLFFSINVWSSKDLQIYPQQCSRIWPRCKHMDSYLTIHLRRTFYKAQMRLKCFHS